MQEVLLSNVLETEVCCGHQKATWASINLLMLMLQKVQSTLGPVVKRAFLQGHMAFDLAVKQGRAFASGSFRVPLLEALVLGRKRSAGTDSDHVFAVLGFSDLNGFPGEGDYEATTMAVYLRVVRHIVETDKNLDILSACKGCIIKNQQCFADTMRVPNRYVIFREENRVSFEDCAAKARVNLIPHKDFKQEMREFQQKFLGHVSVSRSLINISMRFYVHYPEQSPRRHKNASIFSY